MCATDIQVSTPLVKNIILLDSEGKRVAVKYFSDEWPTLAAKMNFEKSLLSKTQRANARAEGRTTDGYLHRQAWCNGLTGGSLIRVFFICAAEIGIFDGFVVVYRFISDLHFFVTGSEDENELILDSVLEAFFEAVAQLLRWGRSNMLSLPAPSAAALIMHVARVNRILLEEVSAVTSAEVMWRSELCWRTWTLSSCASMRLLMAGKLPTF